jgi:hypothetical protein
LLQFSRDVKNKDSGQETAIEWQYNGERCSTTAYWLLTPVLLAGHACTGVYQPVTAATVLNFHLKSSTVVITYRVQDQNSELLPESVLALCVLFASCTHASALPLQPWLFVLWRWTSGTSRQYKRGQCESPVLRLVVRVWLLCAEVLLVSCLNLNLV